MKVEKETDREMDEYVRRWTLLQCSIIPYALILIVISLIEIF